MSTEDKEFESEMERIRSGEVKASPGRYRSNSSIRRIPGKIKSRVQTSLTRARVERAENRAENEKQRDIYRAAYYRAKAKGARARGKAEGYQAGLGQRSRGGGFVNALAGIGSHVNTSADPLGFGLARGHSRGSLSDPFGFGFGASPQRKKHHAKKKKASGSGKSIHIHLG